MNIIDHALKLTEWGWAVFPLNGKRPYPRYKWREQSYKAEGLVRGAFARYNGANDGCNIGVDCGKSGLVVVDLDVSDDRDGIEAFRKLCAEHNIDTKPAVISKTGSGGLHIIFKDPTGGLIGNSASKLGPGIDIRANGGYIVAPPSIHPNGTPYAWVRNGHGPGLLPPELVKLILATPEPEPRPQPARNGNGDYAGYVARALDNEIHAVENAIQGTRNDQLFKSAAALGQIVAAPWADLAQGAVETALRNACLANGLLKDDGENSVTKTITSGLEHGMSTPRAEPPPLDDNPDPIRVVIAPPQPGKEDAVEDATENEIEIVSIRKYRPEQLTGAVLEAALKRNEMGDAEVLARLYPEHLRFDHSDETWYVWDGVHWQPDALNSVRHLVNRQVGGQYLQAAAEARLSESGNSSNLAKRASNLGSKSRLNNVMDLASSLRTFAMEGSEWDADPMLLGVANGVIDLATGEFRPGRPSDYIQKVAPTRWEGLDAKAPRWEQFLDEIFDEDQELVAFVRRLFGYGVTGMHNENIFVILWGHGRNGKDTLLEALGHTLGEALADRVPSDILVGDGGRRGNASPELMELRGQRIAWVSETRKAAKLNVNQVKDITGRSTLKARPLYGNYISFPVQYLLLLLTNNKPVIPADDYAIWKRVLLVPFTLSFVDNPQAHNERQRDGTLSRKLAREASGILAWLVRGCLEWQKNGLKPPSSVVEATEEYRTEEDVISQFLEEMCYVDKSDPDVYVEARELRKTYNDWANANGERIMRQREFGQRMAKLFQKGKHPDNSKRTTIYLGVGLLGSDSI